MLRPQQGCLSSKFTRIFRRRSRSRSQAGSNHNSNLESASEADAITERNPTSVSDILEHTDSLYPQHATSNSGDISGQSIDIEEERCSHLWTKALAEAQCEDQWTKYCKILAQEDLARLLAHDLQYSSDPIENSILPASSAIDITNIATDVQTLSISKEVSASTDLSAFCIKAANCLQSLNGIGAVLMSTNPYTGLAWGIVQFLAGAVSKSCDTRRLCWENLTTLRPLVDQCQILERSYSRAYKNSSSKHLMDEAMIKFFAAVLNYEISVVVFEYSKLWKFKAIFQDKSDNQPQVYLEEIEKRERNLTSLHQSLGSAYQIVVTETMQEALKIIAQTTKSQCQTLLSQNTYLVASARRADRMQILQWISTIRFAGMQNILSKVRCPETTEWILKSFEFTRWYQGKSGSTLWIKGPMGTGKSCLASFIIDHFEHAGDVCADQKLMYFYCVGSEQAGLTQISNVVNILRSLVQQLAASEDPTTIPDFIIRHYEDAGHRALLTDGQCVEFLLKMLSNVSLSILIIDGLDECPRQVQLDLRNHLRIIQDSTQSVLKIIILSRPEVEQICGNFHDHIIDIAQYTKFSIRSMINQPVQEASTQPLLRSKYFHRDRDLTKVVISKLEEKAGGMYRWVDMALAYVHQSKTFVTMEHRITELSTLPDLFDLYDKVYQNVIEAAEESERRAIYVALLLTFYGLNICNTYREEDDDTIVELGVDWLLVGEACAFAQLDSHGDCLSCEDLTDLVPGFLRKGLDTLSISHLSIKDYLVAKHKEQYSYDNGHAILATLRMNAFIKGDEADILNSTQGFVWYAGHKWLNHLKRCCYSRQAGSSEEYTITLAARTEELPDLKAVLKSFLLVSEAPRPFALWSQWVENIPADRALTIESACQNARRVWLNPCSTILARMYLDYGWQDTTHTLDVLQATHTSICMKSPFNSLHMAVRTRLCPAIDWLVSRGMDPNERDTGGKNPFNHLLTSCERCRKSTRNLPSSSYSGYQVLESLVQNGFSFTDRDCGSHDLLIDLLQASDLYDANLWKDIKSAYGRKLDIFHLHKGMSLLEYGTENDARKDIAQQWLDQFHVPEVRSFALFAACRWPLPKYIKLFLDHGADPVVTNDCGLTPLEVVLISSFDGFGSWVPGQISLITDATLDAGFDLSTIVSKTFDSPSHRIPLFHCIVKWCSLEMVDLWVRNGASTEICSISINNPSAQPETASRFARRLTRLDIVEYFRVLRQDDAGKLVAPPGTIDRLHKKYGLTTDEVRSSANRHIHGDLQNKHHLLDDDEWDNYFNTYLTNEAYDAPIPTDQWEHATERRDLWYYEDTAREIELYWATHI